MSLIEKIKNMNKLKLSIIIYGLIIIIAIALTIIITTFISPGNNYLDENKAPFVPEKPKEKFSRIEITNYNDVIGSSIPENFQQLIEESLFVVVVYNSGTIQDKLSGVIRIQSFYQHIDVDNVVFSNFIIDIFDIKQSYQANIISSFTNVSIDYAVVIRCPEKQDVIFDDFVCKNPIGTPQ